MSTKKLMVAMLVMALMTFTAVYLTAVFENLWIWGIWFILLALLTWAVLFKPKRRHTEQ
ncbi:hypothetical protein [Kurthia massiliensis]|uniref:hypothetical protein n=1 Tax=Kurthia massiliensis TaxID=1033739 RepID=UPI000301F0AB|nr:hypothetical protein [Kurthia massiliensis]